jgi:hypothetical protein
MQLAMSVSASKLSFWSKHFDLRYHQKPSTTKKKKHDHHKRTMRAVVTKRDPDVI